MIRTRSPGPPTRADAAHYREQCLTVVRTALPGVTDIPTPGTVINSKLAATLESLTSAQKASTEQLITDAVSSLLSKDVVSWHASGYTVVVAELSPRDFLGHSGPTRGEVASQHGGDLLVGPVYVAAKALACMGFEISVRPRSDSINLQLVCRVRDPDFGLAPPLARV